MELLASNKNKHTLKRIRLIRKEKLSQGLPFMINSDELPSYQCYLEYPDGSIKIAEVDSRDSDFKIVGELDFLNAEVFKRKLKLI
ncbi:MAG: hypothetical protein ABI168_07590 [Ginsengibacter sp.]